MANPKRVSPMFFRKPAYLLLSFLLASFAVGCGGNDKQLGVELNDLGAMVLNHAGKDGVPATVMLSNMKGQEVDLDKALPLVAKLTQVESLILNGTKVTDDHLAMVGKVSSLVDLQLTDTGISDTGVKHLTGLSRLGSLNLSGTKVTGSCFSDVAKLQGLTGLYIEETAVSGGYAALQALPNLELLVANKLTITEKDAKEIAEIPILGTLYVNGAKLEGGSKGILKTGVQSVSLEDPKPAAVE